METSFIKWTFQAATTAMFTVAITAAQADTFNYSYVFATGYEVSGSFDGTASGDLVTGLSNITATYRGVDFNQSGSLFSARLDNSSSPAQFVSVGAVASFSGTQNNFIFSDTDLPTTGTIYYYFGNFFSFLPQEDGSYNQREAFSYTRGLRDIEYSTSQRTGIWNLAPVSAVPEPETYAMMIAGLGLMGAIARRRKAKQTA